jgi:MraZ protein
VLFLCKKNKKIKKPLEIQKKVVYNVAKWWKVVNSGRKWVIGMFMGQYLHNLDEKGRIIIPTKIRDQLTSSVVVTIGFDKCISLYSMEGWEKFQTSLLALPNTMQDARKNIRVLVGSASTQEFDKQGRINLPSNLLQEATISKECIILGVLDHIEIWAKESWDAYYAEASSTLEDVAEKLSVVGK